MVRKFSSPVPTHIRVVFELPASLWATHVMVVGDFNDGKQSAIPFVQEHDGRWQVTLDLLTGRQYCFHYVVDGEWRTDFSADGFAAPVDGGLPISLIDTTTKLDSLTLASTTPNPLY